MDSELNQIEEALGMELADMGHTLEQTKATAHAKLDEKVTDMCNTLDEAKAMSKEQRQKVLCTLFLLQSCLHLVWGAWGGSPSGLES